MYSAGIMVTKATTLCILCYSGKGTTGQRGLAAWQPMKMHPMQTKQDTDGKKHGGRKEKVLELMAQR